jgi:dethiobiotin synthetase
MTVRSGHAGPAVVLMLGTGTEVGKTWVGAALARLLVARGLRMAARKPAQSYDPGDDDAGRTDAQVLAAATGEDATAVCPPHRWYERALAPPMAAAELGRPIPTIAELAAEVGPPPGAEVVLVETAGGVRSPLAGDGDGLDLGARLAVTATVLVADPGLGTINSVRLSAAAVAVAGLPAPVVFLNRFDPADPLHTANRDWLRARDGFDCVTAVADLADRLAPTGP